MDMMAMAFLFDMASRNRRRLDQRFDIQSPACKETFAENMLSALFRRRRRRIFRKNSGGAHGAVEIEGKPCAAERYSRCLD
ncbi:hypothetical protein [Sinorhizobium alkalisoli]|uniref:hypothetical protein n=1 Tax=Sinorhizobium alkalisoli TaxID=1752398 RepID=UPI00124BCC5A|nr:hypothetical protein [Sinorhizobium alkalisoli]MCA1489418.1 hypothetical protein [Ensifer sp. NBAIM29]QFI65170.1 hypothetical protein EKH55_0296 [Sinorhizobium alkalisoli]